MTGSLFIEKLQISGFRGIGRPLTLDFTAPITLVFAPNGTGKTTFVEAAEWLLTGQVDRLKQGANFDNDFLRSAFEPALVPTVVARLRLDEGLRILHRTPEQTNFGEGKSMESIGPTDLLEKLAPAAADEASHHLHANRLRQHYIRGTRFLTSEALSALVDSDSDMVARRMQVFADLLGIRHLLDAQHDVGRFIAELGGRERSLAAVVEAQSEEVDNLRILSTSNVNTASATSELLSAETILRLEPTNTLRLEARLEKVAAEHEQHARVVARFLKLRPQVVEE